MHCNINVDCRCRFITGAFSLSQMGVMLQWKDVGWRKGDMRLAQGY